MKNMLQSRIAYLLIWTVLSLSNYSSKAQNLVQVINPNPNETFPFTAGITTTNGLRIEVYDNGNIQVWDNYRENYSPMKIGVTFGTNPGNLVIGGFGSLAPACSTTPITGNGTATTPFVSLNTFIVTSPSGRQYTIYQKLTYTVPNKYLFMDFEIVADGGTTPEQINLYAHEDTYAGGNDSSNGYVDRASSPTIVAGQRGNNVAGSCTGG